MAKEDTAKGFSEALRKHDFETAAEWLLEGLMAAEENGDYREALILSLLAIGRELREIKLQLTPYE